MPYYVFCYENNDLAKLKPMEVLAEYEAFKDASKFAKEKRKQLDPAANLVVKVMFAENSQIAEEQLREKREPTPSDD